jgi:hypothetical protein
MADKSATVATAPEAKSMTTEGGVSQFTLALIALTFVTVAGVLAFNPSVGVPALQDHLNSTGTNIASLVDHAALSAGHIKSVCEHESNQECTDYIQEVIDELNSLKHEEGEMRGVYRAGHVWAQYFKLNISKDQEGKEGGKELLNQINKLSDAHTVYNVLSHVRTALTVIFTLILIYMAVIVIEKYLSTKGMLDGASGWKALFYWATHVHVFIITLLSTYVFIVAFQNDFFMDQADFACRTRETIPVKSWGENVTTNSTGSVLVDSFSFDTTCYKDAQEIVNGTFAFLFWILVMFSQLYISTHFLVRHGAASDLVTAVEKIRPFKGPMSKVPTAKKIVYGYQPLTSVHNRR